MMFGFLDLLSKSSLIIVSIEVLILLLLLKLAFSCWVSPVRAHRKLKRHGFNGPPPEFPLGNLGEIVRIKKENKKRTNDSSVSSSLSTTTNISHDIHSVAFPHFARWRTQYGKMFVYWLGAEPFLYIADPEFLKTMSKGVMGKAWGKPDVFRKDRTSMFGQGLVMVEGNDWIRHRHVISPAFTPLNVKVMTSSMVECANKMLEGWAEQIDLGNAELDIEKEIITAAGEIIAKTSFGLSGQNWRLVLEKLRTLQIVLFKSNRYVGVPFSKILDLQKNLEARKLGKEIDGLLFSIINERRRKRGSERHNDLLGLLMNADGGDDDGNSSLTSRELVDECKTFFFAGHETTALALTWTLMLLATRSDWQETLREEIREVVGDKTIDFTLLAGLKKMNWVMNEVLRLYPPAPNAQRQALQDIQVGEMVIPKGTNIWIDTVGMHHDKELWPAGDVNEFSPERFAKDPLYGGCSHKMGFMPFGFGGRMCVGRNLALMEYKIMLSCILSKFSVSISDGYCHVPSHMLSLRPSYGLPLIVKPL